MSVLPVRVFAVRDGTSILRVRLLRLWGKLTHTSDAIQHLNLLFIDSEGELIEAFVRRPDVHRFLPYLFEGAIYKIFGFGLEENASIHRVAMTDTRLSFNSQTSLTQMDEATDIKFFSFRFLPVSRFSDAYENQEYLPDLVGVIVACEPTEFLHPCLPLRKKRITIQLIEGVPANVFLWDSMIPTFENVISDAEAIGQVAVFTSLYIDQQEGFYSFRASRATKVYFNIHCPRLHPFLDRTGELNLGPIDMVRNLSYEEAVATIQYSYAKELNLLKIDIANMGNTFMIGGIVREVNISCSLDAQSSVVYFTIDDASAPVEVMFTAAQLRQIAGDVFTSNDLDWDINFRAILSSIHGNTYQFIVEIGEWNETANRCDLILVKLFAV